jgi:hypothetical protein
MGRMNLGVDNTITFKQDTHQYFDRDQNEFQSVTRILKKLQVPFDKAKISSIMASQIAKEQGISQSEAQTTLLSEWDVKRDSSIDRGESIHKGIELFLRTGNKIMELAGVINFIVIILKQFYMTRHQELRDRLTLLSNDRRDKTRFMISMIIKPMNQRVFNLTPSEEKQILSVITTECSFIPSNGLRTATIIFIPFS